MNPRASDDSSSSDVEAEISDGDGFLPTDRPHTVAEDEGNVIHCLSPFPPFLTQKVSIFCISFAADKSRDVSRLHEGASSSDYPRFFDPVHELGRVSHVDQGALWSAFALPHERFVTALGSSETG